MYYYEVYCGNGSDGFSRFFKHEEKMSDPLDIVMALMELDKDDDQGFNDDDARDVNYAKEISKEDYDHTLTE